MLRAEFTPKEDYTKYTYEGLLREGNLPKTLKIESSAISSTNDFIDKMDRKGMKLHIPYPKKRFSIKLDVLRLGYDVLVGLRRLEMCNFDGLNSLMNELSGEDIIPSRDQCSV